MNSIDIKGTSAEVLLKTLAKSFKTEYKNQYGEYSMEVPESIGKGLISGVNFPSGVGLFQFEVQFKIGQCLNFCSPTIHPFKFFYLLEGNLFHQFSEEIESHEINANQSVILGANQANSNKIFFPEKNKVSLIMLDVDRQKFINQLTFPLIEMDDIYYQIFADSEAKRKLYHHTQYSLKMAHLVTELKNFNSHGLEKMSFQGAKALELLTYMLMLYRDDNKNEDFKSIIRPHDLHKINNVVITIEKKLAVLGTISSIAQEQNISEIKLQEGFQLLFNCSVNEYIIQKRLGTAMQLLLKTDKTISEIVYDVGLSSRSHFSKIFKDKYGVVPTAIRLNRK